MKNLNYRSDDEQELDDLELDQDEEMTNCPHCGKSLKEEPRSMKAQTEIREFEGIKYICLLGEDGQRTITPVNIEDEDALLEKLRALGKEGALTWIKRMREEKGVALRDTSWQAEAQKRLDAVRLERAEAQAVQIGKPLGCY